MAFVKKTWKDRIVQYANRRLLTKSGGEVEQVTVTRDEGAISEAGDQFNASNMNDLENRVKTAFDGLTASDIEYSSGVSVEDKIDTKQDSDVLNIQTAFTTGTTTIQAIQSLINDYGKRTMVFGIVIQALGWFTGMITFHQSTQGGGYLLQMSTGRLWAVTYVNGTITVYEKQEVLSGSKSYVTTVMSNQPSSNNYYYSAAIYIGSKTPTISLINYPGNATNLQSDFTMTRTGEWFMVYTSKSTYAGRPIQISFTLA